ncbi:MAG: phenylacetate-CoA oxygenase subunit PaaC [Rhodobacter sp.]|nr:phenylacetate-CoA oxygenase subunit PaaC [Rhodobacter sp.]MCY4168766.1 phenylacetate-CoA oxygenase subunit PaaC [Rhodobacter sp.]MCY4242702.1 phenylacetate-CoA oxygenase subunit PaaC [Rhodobacter sp.]
MNREEALFRFLLQLGDTTLIMGHRVSEWCGHGPVLEEDIALANIALDLIGQTRLWLGLAGEVEGRGRDADALAYLRDAFEFRNLLIAERPNGDFGHTIMRQFLYDAWSALTLQRLQASSDRRIADIARKAGKEVAYHLERSADLCVRLADGTEESHDRMQAALNLLWPYTGEMFTPGDPERELAETGAVPNPTELRDEWLTITERLRTEGGLAMPDGGFAHLGGKSGRHSEHLGYVLAEMQWLQRAYPGAEW